jgi:23S rRNA (cytidine1920-2'-O)/16S rRNA (cytidine1409-2'-O)-methyltransferase
MKKAKHRLDMILVDRGLAPSRERAKAMVMSGAVFVEGVRVDKPGTAFSVETEVVVKGDDHPWVSRGGLKLAHALEEFGLDVTGRTALDIGASTGGFTDVLLQGGAAQVYAVDVGHGQLDWRLRNDPRVVTLERTNARNLTTDQVPEAIEVVVCDASFIGLRTVLPAGLALATPGAVLVALIKPQFEVGKDRVGKGGVVRDSALHTEVCEIVRDWLESLPDWTVIGLTESPIKGPAGNVEFLIAARRD